MWMVSGRCLTRHIIVHEDANGLGTELGETFVNHYVHILLCGWYHGGCLTWHIIVDEDADGRGAACPQQAHDGP